MKKLYYIIYIGIFMLLLAGCQDEGMFTPESDGDEPVYVTYRVHMGDETLSRAIGDANKVNELKVGVFQDNQLLKVFTFDKDEFTNVTLPLLKQGTYDLVFWAQKKDNGIYSIDENFNITIDYANYAKYQGISLAETEEFEAFTVVKKNVSVAEPGDTNITLTRPFAQLNIAASEEDIFNKVNKVSFTIDKVYKKFNPLTGVFTDEVAANQEFLYSFSDQDIEAMQYITIDDTNYYYLASAYLLAPEKVKLTGGLYMGAELVKELNVTELPLKANSRTNIYGDMIQQEELQGWDGVIPTESPLTQDEQNRYIIDEEADIAWLTMSENVSGLNAPTFFVKKDVLNMGDKPISSIQLPAGSTFDGNGKTIKYYANSLFGDATNITVQNLNLDNVTATSGGHVGVLVNTLIGNGTFTNVSISNSSATTTNGAAGGMVGYIVRASETDRSEIFSVVFNNCDLVGVTANGSQAEGKFVGLLSGYDYQEALTFDADCSADAATKVTDFASLYRSANQSVWCDDIENTYDGWLGDETYRRGTVIFDETRFIPKWDGATTIEPLIENSSQLIYSPFDLASLQKGNYASVIFKTNVDMANKLFVPIRTINNLDGENNSLYNLYIYEENVTHDGVAFIRTSIGETVHKNLTFCNASISATHNEDTGNAYGGTLCSYVAGTKYTVQNITCTNGELNAVCKMGGLLGRVGSNEFYCSNNHVDGYSLGNYKVDSNPETFSHTVGPILKDGINLVVYSVRNLTAHAEATFYPQGEVGGLIGFIVSNYSEISDCTVKNTRINCYGQKDNTDGINVTGEQKALWGSWKPNFKMNVKYTIAGRHVNEFIGDVRTISGSEKVYVSNCEVENNIYGEGYFNDTHKYNNNKNEIKIIGRAYYVGGEFMGYAFGDKKGEVYVDGTQILEVASASL